jgi:hypothetical protein
MIAPNTLVYYDTATITAVISFIVQPPGLMTYLARGRKGPSYR